MGKTEPQPTNLINITWPTKCVFLGLSFSSDTEAFAKDIFEKQLAALEKCLNVCSSRDLTLLRKISIIRSFVLSKILFLFLLFSTLPLVLLTKRTNLYPTLYGTKNAISDIRFASLK